MTTRIELIARLRDTNLQDDEVRSDARLAADMLESDAVEASTHRKIMADAKSKTQPSIPMEVGSIDGFTFVHANGARWKVSGDQVTQVRLLCECGRTHKLTSYGWASNESQKESP